MLIATTDSETTGLDVRHKCRPFFASVYTEDCGEPVDHVCWHWPVDGKTRMPRIKASDLDEIRQRLDEADLIVGHNIKFDIAAYASAGLLWQEAWWEKTHDTLLASHLWATSEHHDLTYLSLRFLRENIQPHEDRLERVTKEVQGICRREYPRWLVAKEDLPGCPSMKGEKLWKWDTWLAHTYALAKGFDSDHEYFTALPTYANIDTLVTGKIWPILEQQLRDRDLWQVYVKTRQPLIRILVEMEQAGVTYSEDRLGVMLEKHQNISDTNGAECLRRAAGHLDKLPKSGSSNALASLFFQKWKLPVVKTTDKGNPSTDASVLKEWVNRLPPGSNASKFIQCLQAKRKSDTMLAYGRSYQRFSKPLQSNIDPRLERAFRTIYPTLNPTGSDTLRFTCSNPCEQNISKQENVNIREAFGPAPGREWWSLDMENLELRLPAYEANEPAMVDLFEHPDVAPYFGSYHLLVCEVLYPELFAQCLADGVSFKDRYKATLYQWVKNGNFACVPMDTEALTNKGWRTYDTLEIGDEVLAYDKGKLVWTPVLRKVLNQRQKLISLENGKFKAVTTPDHKWVGKSAHRDGRHGQRSYRDTMVSTEGIRTEHLVTLSAPVDDIASIQITDEEAAIIGFAYGDGSIVKSEKGSGPARGIRQEKIGFEVKLFQSKPAGIHFIEELLRKWGKGFKHFIRPTGIQVWRLNPAACRDIWKRANLWEGNDFEQFILNLGPTQRKAFVDAVFAAEGHLNGRGSRVFTQNKGKYSDAIQLAIFMGGKFCNASDKTSYYETPHTNQGITERTPYVTGQRLKKRELKGLHQTWCVTTALSSWVMRQNGNIMLTGNCQYGASEESGTADRAYHLDGAQRIVQERFSNITKLNQYWISHARRKGFVWTMRDSEVGSGYPIQTPKTWNPFNRVMEVKPTIPLNYHIQGTAMWVIGKAMIRVRDYLASLPELHYITMQIHDELVLDFPKGKTPTANLPKVLHVKKLMELGGHEISIPLTAGYAYHPLHWGKDEKLQPTISI